MFDSPISKTQGQLAQAARAATNDYIQNGTDLTEAVVKAASAMQPLTSEHVRRICEMTYHDAYERMFAEKTGMHQYVTFDPPDAILAAEMLDALQLGFANQANFDKMASIKDDAEKAVRETIEDASTPKGLARLIASKALKQDREGLILKKIGLEKEASMFKAAGRGAGIGALLGGGAGYVTGDSEASTKDKLQRAAVGGLAGGAAGHLVAKASGPSIKNLKKHKADLEDDIAFGKKHLDKMDKREAAIRKEINQMKGRIREQEIELKKEASVPSMPRRFKRMNTHEFWTKAASGKDLPDHNPTRELQQVHRDLKDSISTVKSELYSAEHNEKLAMIDMVKQAKAGLSAGHSMEQVLHAAVSVVDATEPLMAKTAHDLCATIIEACAGHQNSGFRKAASFPALTEDQIMSDPHFDPKGGYKNLKELQQKYDSYSKGDPTHWYSGSMGLHKQLYGGTKMAAALQEVNPNHPIPQKFKKLAEANIQRKHLEVTLDELNRNLDYFNEKLVDELTR